MKIKIDKVRTDYHKRKWTWFDIRHKNIKRIEIYSCLVQDDSGEKTYYKFIPYGSYDTFKPIKDIV